jgi:uncharacterized protein
MIDLSERFLSIVRGIVQTHLPHVPVYVFGSRATGKAKKFSDLDLMIQTGIRLDAVQLARAREAFEDSDLPITVDLIEWQACSPKFKDLVKPTLVAL